MSLWKSQEELDQEQHNKGQKDGSKADPFDVFFMEIFPLHAFINSESYCKGWENGRSNMPDSEVSENAQSSGEQYQSDGTDWDNTGWETTSNFTPTPSSDTGLLWGIGIAIVGLLTVGVIAISFCLPVRHYHYFEHSIHSPNNVRIVHCIDCAGGIQIGQNHPLYVPFYCPYCDACQALR